MEVAYLYISENLHDQRARHQRTGVESRGGLNSVAGRNNGVETGGELESLRYKHFPAV